jgi:hypothetical protein
MKVEACGDESPGFLATVRADDHSHKAHTRISTHSQVELYRQMRPEFNRIWG